ncbi:MAG: DUF5667 domain-containing protein [Candidatus Promineifilaceae bacterium]
MGEQPSDKVVILASCIEGIEEDRLTVEACLERYPEIVLELREMIAMVQAIRGTLTAKPPATFSRHARSRLMTKLQPLSIENNTFFDALRHRWQRTFVMPKPRKFSLVWMLVLVAIAFVLLGGGTAYASDAAVPGQPLYALDRSLEEVQARLTKAPEASVTLHLTFAEERLSEAQELASGKGSGKFQDALGDYGETIETIAQTIGAVGDADRNRLSGLLDEAFVSHNAKLFRLAVVNGPREEDGDAAVNRFCAGGETHPVAQSMSEQYAVDIKQIMDWFCGGDKTPGYGFGQIMLALQKEVQLGQDGPSAQEILSRRANGEGWGQIWQDLGLIGKPKDGTLPDRAGPKDNKGSSDEPGPPDHAGPKPKTDSSRDSGPPDHAGPKDKTGSSKNTGPPDHAGRPNGAGPIDDMYPSTP